MSKLKSIAVIFLLTVLSSGYAFPQEVNIIPYLKQIEAGDTASAQSKLASLLRSHPHDPSVLFLKGVLTENGQQAVTIYNTIVNKYPKSKYADAALYRLYSYYYALGLYNAASSFKNKLANEYPGSPYNKISVENIPEKDDTTNEEPAEPAAKIAAKTDTAITEDKIDTAFAEKKDYKYTIQAGAFSVEKNAKSLKKDFEDSGFYSIIKNKIVGGTTFHIVYVGKFVTEDEAKSFLQVINSEFKLEGRVVNLD